MCVICEFAVMGVICDMIGMLFEMLAIYGTILRNGKQRYLVMVTAYPTTIT